MVVCLSNPLADTFSVHVRTVGNWTGMLYKYFEDLRTEKRKQDAALLEHGANGQQNVANGQVARNTNDSLGNYITFDLGAPDAIQV